MSYIKCLVKKKFKDQHIPFKSNDLTKEVETDPDKVNRLVSFHFNWQKELNLYQFIVFCFFVYKLFLQKCFHVQIWMHSLSIWRDLQMAQWFQKRDNGICLKVVPYNFLQQFIEQTICLLTHVRRHSKDLFIWFVSLKIIDNSLV